MSLTGYNPSNTISTAFSSGSYRHIALSISGTTHTLYLDGSAVAVNSNAGNIFSIYNSAIENLYIGCAGDLSYGYTGIIDDFKIWNRVLSKTEINNICYTPKATYTNCTILYTSTYEYYVFTNTSASSTLSFSNTTNIEYLVVGAGGNGGSMDFGGGGGAGGVLNTTATISSGTTLTINVGNYATYSNTQATRGGNSTISGTGITNGTAYGGGSGAFAWQYAAAANTGGSGGGGGAYGYATGGAATTGSGYNGTSGGDAGNGFGSGGGGGAGGNGGNSIYQNPTGIGGVGGNGTSVYSDWIITIAGYMNTVFTDWSTYTTSNGVSYIASGGAGGTGTNGTNITSFTARKIGGGGSGGQSCVPGISSTIMPTAGIPNTGGGGGGFGGGYPGYYQYFNNVGGSGIVIVRTLI
jgi:hypothetical protein